MKRFWIYFIAAYELSEYIKFEFIIFVLLGHILKNLKGSLRPYPYGPYDIEPIFEVHILLNMHFWH